MVNLSKRRVQFAFFIVGIISLSMTAQKCRELVGEESASKSGQFSFFDCFDMGSGTLSCAVKEGVKLYVYSIRSAHVERVRQQAVESALTEALSEGLGATAAAKQAQKVGAKAAKEATRQAKRIIGPIISSGWDFFEATYYGGTITEGFLRGTGTLFGTYLIGYHGEEALGRVGYLLGSHLGSWVGGRVGLMVYDVVSAVDYLLQFSDAEGTASENIGSGGYSSGDAEYNNEDKMLYETHTENGEFEAGVEETRVDYHEQSSEASSDILEPSEGWGFL